MIQAGTRDTLSVREIAELAEATAAALGLTAEQRRNIHLAGLLCDLGKMTLPEALVRTPIANMTDVQVAEFKRHTLAVIVSTSRRSLLCSGSLTAPRSFCSTCSASSVLVHR